MSPVRLLLLQANPDSDLNIDGEERALRQALDAAEHGRHFEIHRNQVGL